ncbi:hypothetical protein BDW75DRAFT_219759 [Aspergillus navahoensis]
MRPCTVNFDMRERALAAQPAKRHRRRRRNRTAQLYIASLFLFFVILLAIETNAHPLENEGKNEAYPVENLIAIHLGATESRVGVKDNNIVRILDTIPSYVTATDIGHVAGGAAKALGGPNLYKAALDMINYFADESSGSTVSYRAGDMFSYSMQNRHQNLQVLSNGTSSSFTPTDIFSPILLELRSIAQSYLGPRVNITGAVMTFPHPYGYNDINTIDNFVDDIQRAGETVNLPIVRTMRETTSIGMALGLDILSETDGERYAILYDLADDFDTLTTTVFEVEDGVFDALSFHREDLVSEAGYLEKKNPRYADTKKSAVSERLDEGFTLEHPVFDNREAKTSYLQGSPPCLSCHIQMASIHAIHDALTKAGLSVDQITDLIFTPAFRSFPRLQGRVARWFNNNTRIGNSDDLAHAAVWGATLVSSYMAEDDGWVGGSCSKSRPAIGISTENYPVVEIIPASQSLPSFGKQTFIAPCRDGDQAGNTTGMKVYLRDIPAVDYHAKFELGDQYVFDPTPEDIFLGEFELPLSCGMDQFLQPPAIKVSALLSRNSVLHVQATNMDSGESRTLTFPDASTHCADNERYSPRNYTLALGGDLETEYGVDLRRFVGPSRDQKPVEAFDRGLFPYP